MIVICGLHHTVVLALPSFTRPRTRPARCGVKVTCRYCFCGVAGGLFHVTDDDGSAVPAVTTAGRLLTKLVIDDPDVPMYSSNRLISSLFNEPDEMISTVAVFEAPITVFSISNQKQ